MELLIEQQERELKISLIGEIFGQIKFIGEKLKPFPIVLKAIVMKAYKRDRSRNGYGHTFDTLYSQDNQYLQALEVSLRTHVNRKAGERRAGFTQHLGRVSR